MRTMLCLVYLTACRVVGLRQLNEPAELRIRVFLLSQRKAPMANHGRAFCSDFCALQPRTTERPGLKQHLHPTVGAKGIWGRISVPGLQFRGLFALRKIIVWGLTGIPDRSPHQHIQGDKCCKHHLPPSQAACLCSRDPRSLSEHNSSCGKGATKRDPRNNQARFAQHLRHDLMHSANHRRVHTGHRVLRGCPCTARYF